MLLLDNLFSLVRHVFSFSANWQASLRSQVDKANKMEFPQISPERYIWLLLLYSIDIGIFRAFADFVFGSIVLHFFVVTFIG